jgi:cyclopropane-fatty-acyl-phospholipid synthase
LWLDRGMVYSCAYFRSAEDGLEAAQCRSSTTSARKLRLRRASAFLDVGCGWGALAIRAAEKYGADATGITLSENQHRLAAERIRAPGLQDRCRVLLEDYRDHAARTPYDKIASVGMFEHVGSRTCRSTSAPCRRCCASAGSSSTTASPRRTPATARWDWARASSSTATSSPRRASPPAPCVRDMSAAGFEVHDVECLRPHYAARCGLERALRAPPAPMRSPHRASAPRASGASILRMRALPRAAMVSISRCSLEADEARTLELPLTRDWMYGTR